MTESTNHKVMVIGPDGQPVGYAEVPAGSVPSRGEGENAGTSDGEAVVRSGGCHRRAGQGDADRHDDQAIAGGGPGGPAGRGQPGPAARGAREVDQGTGDRSRPRSCGTSWNGCRLPFSEDTIPSEGELRIAQAQLVGWLEGVFHGLQAALVAQQMAARVQLEQMRRGAAARAVGGRRIWAARLQCRARPVPVAGGERTGRRAEARRRDEPGARQ